MEALIWAFGIFVYLAIIGSCWLIVHGAHQEPESCPHGHTGDWSDNCPDCRH